MEVKYISIDTDSVSIGINITMSVKDWKTLMDQLPINQPLCLLLKENIVKLIETSALTKAIK